MMLSTLLWWGYRQNNLRSHESLACGISIMPIRSRLLFCPILLMLLPRPDANIAHANKLRRIREEGTTKSTPSPLAAGYRPKSIELQSTSSEPDAEPSSAIQSPVNMPINEPTSFSTPKYSKQPRSLSSKSNVSLLW